MLTLLQADVILTVLIHVIQLRGDKMIIIDYKDKRSIYEQIEGGIKELIINRILKDDEKLPSVRELAIMLTVNPNTVQRAYRQLEADGYIYSIKGKGNFVSPASELIEETDTKDLYEALSSVVRELKFLNESKEKIQTVINKLFEEE